MLNVGLVIVAAAVVMAPASQEATGEFIALFDGRSLEGWEGDETVFRVADGAIVGGTLEQPIPQREYLCTTREFDDFELRVSAKVEGEQNSGVHFRSQRVPGTNEVGGYQADIGFISGAIVQMLSDVKDIDSERSYPLWGSLLDEFRDHPGRYPLAEHPYWLLAVADRDIVDDAYQKDDWNRLAVTAVGPRIEIHLNGVRTVEFTEQEDLVQDGLICLQVHNGGPSRVWFKDIEIRELNSR